MKKALLILMTLALACGGGGDSIPIAQLQTKLLDALCSYYVRCGQSTDTATCEKSASAAELVGGINIGPIDTTVAALPAVAAGRADYDGGQRSSAPTRSPAPRAIRRRRGSNLRSVRRS